jgi:hypothetical protein
MGAQTSVWVALTSTDLLFVHFVRGRPEPLIGFCALKFQIALLVKWEECVAFFRKVGGSSPLSP